MPGPGYRLGGDLMVAWVTKVAANSLKLRKVMESWWPIHQNSSKFCKDEISVLWNHVYSYFWGDFLTPSNEWTWEMPCHKLFCLAARYYSPLGSSSLTAHGFKSLMLQTLEMISMAIHLGVFCCIIYTIWITHELIWIMYYVIPSRELTCHFPNHFWRWLSFSPGRDMLVLWRVYQQLCSIKTGPTTVHMTSPPCFSESSHCLTTDLRRGRHFGCLLTTTVWMIPFLLGAL